MGSTRRSLVMGFHTTRSASLGKNEAIRWMRTRPWRASSARQVLRSASGGRKEVVESKEAGALP
uniref:Uncharacterized protein n=1 Tax=Arundo donax TaxID=35708 RepID=A0A0A8ZRK8_ARUDO